MAFVQINGLEGKVYVPDEKPEATNKKHKCKDCYSCQVCSETRCALCLGQGECTGKGASNK